MSSKNTEATSLGALRDWLYCTKKQVSEKLTSCNATDRYGIKEAETRELQERYELNSQEKHRHIKDIISRVPTKSNKQRKHSR